MNLYRTTWIDDEKPGDERYCHQWHGTQADYKAHEKSLKTDMMICVKTESTEVPTGKDDLLDWLNINSK